MKKEYAEFKEEEIRKQIRGLLKDKVLVSREQNSFLTKNSFDFPIIQYIKETEKTVTIKSNGVNKRIDKNKFFGEMQILFSHPLYFSGSMERICKSFYIVDVSEYVPGADWSHIICGSSYEAYKEDIKKLESEYMLLK